MDDVLTDGEIIHQSRWKSFLRFVGCLVFVGLALWLHQSGIPSTRMTLAVWLGFALFGPGALLFLVQTLRPGTLEISSRGLTQSTMFRRTEWTWDVFQQFQVMQVRGAKMVAFDLAPSSDAPGLMQQASRALGGDGALAPGWAIPPEALAAKLNAALERWGPRRQTS